MQWESYKIGLDRHTTILRVGRWDLCAEEAHAAAFTLYETLRAKDRRTYADDLRKIGDSARGEPRAWIWALAGTTFGVRRQQVPGE